MEYNGVKFDAIVSTPGSGKSYMCDKYPNIFVDIDEERLRCKYVVPDNITRAELEKTKGSRDFQRRAKREEYIQMLYEKLDKYRAEGKVMIAAPHPEAIDYLISRNIPYCFVYPNKYMKEELNQRFLSRNNPADFVKENNDMFDEWLVSNRQDTRPVVHYEFGKGEFLENIMRDKFGFVFE